MKDSKYIKYCLPPPRCENSPRVLRSGDDNGEHGGEVEVQVGRARGREQELSSIREQLVNLLRSKMSDIGSPGMSITHHFLLTVTCLGSEKMLESWHWCFCLQRGRSRKADFLENKESRKCPLYHLLSTGVSVCEKVAYFLENEGNDLYIILCQQ